MSAAHTGLGFTLTEADEKGRRPLLRSTDGAPIAHVDNADPPVVHPAVGLGWRVEPFGRGWRLAAREVKSGHVLCSYKPRPVRSGGTLLLASERAYDVRSTLRRRPDLQVMEGRHLLLDLRAVPRNADCRIEVARHRPPRHAQDEVLIVSFLSVFALLVFHAREAHGQLGPDGTV